MEDENLILLYHFIFLYHSLPFSPQSSQIAILKILFKSIFSVLIGLCKYYSYLSTVVYCDYISFMFFLKLTTVYHFFRLLYALLTVSISSSLYHSCKVSHIKEVISSYFLSRSPSGRTAFSFCQIAL